MEEINEFDPEWGDFDDTEWDFPEFENKSDDSNWSDSEDDIEETKKSRDDIYYLDGYGEIYELDDYLKNSAKLIELLEHSKSKEQFNYIVAFANEEAFDDTLLSYLISKNYGVDDFLSSHYKNTHTRFKGLVEYLLSIADENKKEEILDRVTYCDDYIISEILKRDNYVELLRENHNFCTKEMTEKIIELFKSNPSKINFDVLNSCPLDYDSIKEFIALGYEINKSSPYDILNNNRFMKEKILEETNISKLKIFKKLEKELDGIKGSYGKLYLSDKKNLLNPSFEEIFTQDDFKELIKYVVLGDYQVDLSLVNDNTITKIKEIYSLVSTDTKINIQLFIDILYKFNMNPSVFDNFDKNSINVDKLKLYINYKDLVVRNINDINDLDKILYYYENKRIDECDNIFEIKNVICNLLTNESYFEVKKCLYEMGNKEKLSVLKNCIKDEEVSKKLDSYIILSEFLENIDNSEDLDNLKNIAKVVNKKVLDNGINYDWLNFKNKLLEFYSIEINEKMTDFNEYLIDKDYVATDQQFNDGVNVKGKKVRVSYIKSGEEFNSFIHVLNAYRNSGIEGTYERVKNPSFIGQAYISLSGISDEYNRICVNMDSRSSIKVLYSYLPTNSLICASNRDMGTTSFNNSNNIDYRIVPNISPFRRLVRNTIVIGSETYNEYDVYRDNLVPSGIAYMSDEPTEEEINVAAYLDVPLVKIDDLSKNFVQDFFAISGHAIHDDESYYNIKEHSFEDKPVVVSPNTKYDYFISELNNTINKDKKFNSTRVYEEINEYDKGTYYCDFYGEKYLAEPIYNKVDDRRCNVDEDYYEKKLVQYKLFNLLNEKSSSYFGFCKYPNGKEAMSLIYKENLDKDIEYLVNYLSDVCDCRTHFDYISDKEFSTELLNKINSISTGEYISLFDDVIRSCKFIEPKIIVNNIIERKANVRKLLMEKNIEDNKRL